MFVPLRLASFTQRNVPKVRPCRSRCHDALPCKGRVIPAARAEHALLSARRSVAAGRSRLRGTVKNVAENTPLTCVRIPAVRKRPLHSQ